MRTVILGHWYENSAGRSEKRRTIKKIGDTCIPHQYEANVQEQIDNCRSCSTLTSKQTSTRHICVMLRKMESRPMVPVTPNIGPEKPAEENIDGVYREEMEIITDFWL